MKKSKTHEKASRNTLCTTPCKRLHLTRMATCEPGGLSKHGLGIRERAGRRRRVGSSSAVNCREDIVEIGAFQNSDKQIKPRISLIR